MALSVASPAGAGAAPPRPSAAEARAVCRHVAATGPAIAADLVSTGDLDANNDGRPDRVSVVMSSGTAGGDELQFRPQGAPPHSRPTRTTPVDFQGKDYWSFGARWLRFGGWTYTLNFTAENLRHPTYLSVIDADNAERLVCAFASTEQERLTPAAGPGAAALCERIAAGRLTPLSVAAADGSAPVARRNTTMVGTIRADVGNTGHPVRLALLDYQSGAGRGCGFRYFDVLGPGGVADSGPLHDQLMALQGVTPAADRTGGPCGAEAPHWLRDGDITYLEARNRFDEYPVAPSHTVRRLQDGRIAAVCRGEFTPRWSVTEFGPAFR